MERLRGGEGIAASASFLASNPEVAKSLIGEKFMTKTRIYGDEILPCMMHVAAMFDLLPWSDLGLAWRSGFVLVAVGILLSTLGFMLFFNRSLIGTGNLTTILGVVRCWQGEEEVDSSCDLARFSLRARSEQPTSCFAGRGREGRGDGAC